MTTTNTIKNTPVTEALEVNPGYKKTKLGWMPEEWDIVPLSEILTNYRLGGNYVNSKNTQNIPLIKMGNIGRGNIHLSNIEYLEDDDAIIMEDLLKKGDLLFNTRNSIDLVGKVAIWNDELLQAVYNSNLLRLSFNDQVYSNFFMNYNLNSYLSIKWLRKIATGTTSVAAIYTKDLLKLQVPIPPLPEQQKIAAILSTWDEAIEHTQNLITQLKNRKKGLMQQLLTGKTRLPGFDCVWDEVKLGDILEVYGKKTTEQNQFEVFTSSRKGLVPQKEYFGEGRITDRTNIGFNIIPPNFITYRSRSDDGTFKFNINYSKETGAISHYYPVFNMKNGSNQFFQSFTEVFNHLFYRYSVGTSQIVLSINAIKTIRVRFPQFKEQKAIAKVLNSADAEITQQESYLAALQTQKKGLMQQLLTGKTRVNLD